jgi:hypothetical protein
MADVSISYKHEDYEKVAVLAKFLANERCATSWDTSLLGSRGKGRNSGGISRSTDQLFVETEPNLGSRHPRKNAEGQINL